FVDGAFRALAATDTLGRSQGVRRVGHRGSIEAATGTGRPPRIAAGALLLRPCLRATVAALLVARETAIGSAVRADRWARAVTAHGGPVLAAAVTLRPIAHGRPIHGPLIAAA